MRGTDRALVVAGAGQTPQQEGEEGGQDLAQRPGRVVHDDLPDVQRGLPHHERGVGAPHVETRQHTVASLVAQC